MVWARPSPPQPRRHRLRRHWSPPPGHWFLSFLPGTTTTFATSYLYTAHFFSLSLSFLVNLSIWLFIYVHIFIVCLLFNVKSSFLYMLLLDSMFFWMSVRSVVFRAATCVTLHLIQSRQLHHHGNRHHADVHSASYTSQCLITVKLLRTSPGHQWGRTYLS